jgi:transposase
MCQKESQEFFMKQEQLCIIERLSTQGKSVEEIAEATGFSKICIYKRLQSKSENGIVEVKRPGRRPIDQNNRISLVSEIVQSDNTLNLSGIQGFLETNNITLSKSSVCVLLKKAHITRKRLKTVTLNSVSHEVVESRAVYARIFNRFEDERLIFLDETGINLHTSKFYGYSPMSMDAIKNIRGDRGRNISTLAAITVNGVIGSASIPGAFKVI